MKPLTPELLAAATGAPKDRSELYFEPIMSAMSQFKIDGLWPTSAFLAQIGIESQRLTKVEESLYYNDPERIARLYLRIFDKDHDRVIEPAEVDAARSYVRNHGALSKLLYNGYHGRGLIQITWERNYALATTALGFDYIGNPDLVKEPKHAALTAAWFFASNGCCVLGDDIKAVTAKINPALLALDERTAQYVANKGMLA